MEKSEDKSVMEKTTVGFIFCLKCGKTYQSIMKIDDQWKCESCGNPFPLGKDGKIGQESVKEEEIDAIRCDKCKKLTSVTPDNFSGDDRLICSNGCNDWKGNSFLGHVVARKFRQTWYPQSWFLKGKKESSKQLAQKIEYRYLFSTILRKLTSTTNS